MTWAPVAWKDGSLSQVDDLSLPAMSFAALYGFSLFETLRAYGGAPFALGRHVDRMAAGAAELNMVTPLLDEDTLADAIGQVLAANDLGSARERRDAAIRITLAAEGNSWDDLRPSLTVAARPFPGYPADWYTEGIDLVVAPWRRCARDAMVGLKSANYLTCLRAREFALREGAQEALLRNCAGQIVEGAVTNFFAVLAGGLLATPPVDDGLLPGVTRAIVLELAADAGLLVAERSISPEDLPDLREAFVTNSLMEIVPVRALGERPVTTCPGGTTLTLSGALRHRIHNDSAR